jgi:hypothetical protein
MAVFMRKDWMMMAVLLIMALPGGNSIGWGIAKPVFYHLCL